MPRSQKKGYFIDPGLESKILEAQNSGSRKPIKTWSRNSTIIPECVGLTMSIHNGRKFVDVLITEDMVGHKMGEFSETRTFKGHMAKN